MTLEECCLFAEENGYGLALASSDGTVLQAYADFSDHPELNDESWESFEGQFRHPSAARLYLHSGLFEGTEGRRAQDVLNS